MKILITGVAGFVGKNIAQKLLDQGHEVYGIDNFFNSTKSDVPKGVVFFEIDVANVEWFDFFKNIDIDIVIHLAAQSSGEVSFKIPNYDCNTNVIGTLNVCEFSKKNKVKKILFASSMSVYGESQGLVSEETPLIPLSLYAVGKKASEDYLRIYSRQFDIDVACLRFFNIYGIGQNLENMSQGMISIFLAQALNEEKIIVKGSLKRYRDFIYISDVVDILEFLAKASSLNGFVTFNVGTGEKTYLSDLISTIQTVSQTKKDVIIQNGTLGDQNGIYANNSKLIEITNKRKFTTLNEGLQEWVTTLKRENNFEN